MTDESDDDPCYKCGGEGGWHDCGDDTCVCLDPEAFDSSWIECDECGGKG